jgi:hypothetical protein
MSYNIPFAHNIALKIALDFASEQAENSVFEIKLCE